MAVQRWSLEHGLKVVHLGVDVLHDPRLALIDLMCKVQEHLVRHVALQDQAQPKAIATIKIVKSSEPLDMIQRFPD